MKKALKIIGIVIGVIVAITAVVVVWKWDVVKAAYMTMRYDTKTIDDKLANSQVNLQKSIESHTDIVFREITEEEQAEIDTGKKTKAEIVSKIFNEGIEHYLEENGKLEKTTEETDISTEDGKAESKANGKSENKKGEAAANNTENSKNVNQQTGKEEKSSSDKNTQNQESAPAKTGGSTYDAIVANYTSKMYALQGKYMGQLSSLIGQAEAEFHSLPQSQWTVSNRSAIISKYIGVASGLEAACDGEVNAVLSGLQSELSAIGADTSIVSVMRNAYHEQKSLQASSYMSQMK